MTGDVLRNVAEVLSALHVSNLSELGVRLSEDSDPDIWVELEADGSLMVACEVTGLSLPFPTTLENLWTMVAHLEDLAAWDLARESLAEDVAIEEGLTVEVGGPEPEQGEWAWPDHVGEYPFDAPAPGDWTVEQWRRTRFLPTYPGFEVTVLRQDGSTASDVDALADLRVPADGPSSVEGA